MQQLDAQDRPQASTIAFHDGGRCGSKQYCAIR